MHRKSRHAANQRVLMMIYRECSTKAQQWPHLYSKGAHRWLDILISSRNSSHTVPATRDCLRKFTCAAHKRLGICMWNLLNEIVCSTFYLSKWVLEWIVGNSGVCSCLMHVIASLPVPVSSPRDSVEVEVEVSAVPSAEEYLLCGWCVDCEEHSMGRLATCWFEKFKAITQSAHLEMWRRQIAAIKPKTRELRQLLSGWSKCIEIG